MPSFLHSALCTLHSALCATAAPAETPTVYPFDDSFAEATSSVENAIIGKGLVIDYVSQTGGMLNRTGADVGSDDKISTAADVFLFCSAAVSRAVMEAEPMNIAHCPSGIFVAEKAGDVMIGYRTYPEGEMQKVQSLLDEIVQDARGR